MKTQNTSLIKALAIEHLAEIEKNSGQLAKFFLWSVKKKLSQSSCDAEIVAVFRKALDFNFWHSLWDNDSFNIILDENKKFLTLAEKMLRNQHVIHNKNYSAFADVPDVIIQNIFSFFDNKQLRKIKPVCRRFKALSSLDYFEFDYNAPHKKECHHAASRLVSLTPDGKIIGLYDWRFYFWDIKTFQFLTDIENSAHKFVAGFNDMKSFLIMLKNGDIAFAFDGLHCEDPYFLFFIDQNTGKLKYIKNDFRFHIKQLQQLNSGQLLYICRNWFAEMTILTLCDIHERDGKTNLIEDKSIHITPDVSALAISKNDKIALGCKKGKILSWETNSDQFTEIVLPISTDVLVIKHLSDEVILVGTGNSQNTPTLYSVNLQTQQIIPFPACHKSIHKIEILENGNIVTQSELAYSTKQSIEIWDIETRECLTNNNSFYDNKSLIGVYGPYLILNTKQGVNERFESITFPVKSKIALNQPENPLYLRRIHK